MTTQDVQATISNPRMGKVFSKNATDDVWDGNTLTDTISGQQVGILMPGTTITSVQCQYSGGLAAWRIQNAQSLAFNRWGFGTKDGLACYHSDAIAPYSINPNDIFTVYPLPVDSATGKSNVLAWIETSKGVELFEAKAVDNGVPTEMKTVVNDQTLGDSMFNSTLACVKVQAEDGATVDEIQIVDNSGGVVLTLFGGTRGASGGAMSLTTNLMAEGLAVAIGKGFKINVQTTTA